VTETPKRPRDPAQPAEQIAAKQTDRDQARPDPASRPPPEPSPRTYKSAILRRATHYEAELIELALTASSAKYRDLFRDVQYLDHDDPRFAVLRNGFIDAFGEARADELLAPSE
jgi:hypothetical protein